MHKKKTVAEELISGFTELAEALESNADLGDKFSCYQIQLDLQPRTYTPELVRTTRKKLGASQTVFAKFLGVSPKTVRLGARARKPEPNRLSVHGRDPDKP